MSALQHLLGNNNTMPAALGIFLPETHRLAPAVCNFTSEAFYDGRLTSRSGREKQVLSGVAGIEGAGLWVKKVAHEGNKNSSAEEAQAVALLAKTLVAKGSLWTDAEGTTHPMLDQDLCIVAAYNAQVAHIKSALREHLPNAEIAVGTVDKFQGQEAPVVIYSMASSSAEDAARGMEFLYSLNRLNVATSRAKCACILVASPRIFEVECRSPRQMQLANAFCLYLEMAREV